MRGWSLLAAAWSVGDGNVLKLACDAASHEESHALVEFLRQVTCPLVFGGSVNS